MKTDSKGILWGFWKIVGSIILVIFCLTIAVFGITFLVSISQQIKIDWALAVIFGIPSVLPLRIALSYPWLDEK